MKKIYVPLLVTIACIVMGLVDAVIQPGYAVKSLIKILLFLLIPLTYSFFSKEHTIKSVFKPDKKGLLFAVGLGFAVYGVVLGAYLFLEEFFFRGFAFLSIKNTHSKKFAYIFSSLAFALYHIAMMIGWFGLPVILISVLGLFVGGTIFNKFDEKNENIYLSWLVHMFANFATNTIGFILFAIG